MLFFYVRHGDPIYKPDSLTPLGNRQAESVAKRLALYGIDELYASTSNRAILTATPTSELVKKEIKTLDFCNENYAWDDFAVFLPDGDRIWPFQNKASKTAFVKREVIALGDKWYEYDGFLPNNFKRGVERINCETDNFFASLGYVHDRVLSSFEPKNHTNKRVALFAHQGFGMAFLSSLLNIPYPVFCTHFDISHSSMTVIEFGEPNEDGRVIPQILTLANDSHLFRDGLPTTYNDRTIF